MKEEPQEGIPWLKALRNLDTVTQGEAEQIDPAAAFCSADEISNPLTRQGAKSPSGPILALLSLPHVGTFTLGMRECEADVGRDSASLMPRECAPSLLS